MTLHKMYILIHVHACRFETEDGDNKKLILYVRKESRILPERNKPETTLGETLPEQIGSHFPTGERQNGKLSRTAVQLVRRTELKHNMKRKRGARDE